MQTADVMLVVLLVAAVAACGVAVWAFLETAKTMRSVRELAEQARERLNPVLEKADVTIDAVNAELLRVDAIITQFEDAGAKVTSASGAISGLVTAPSDIVANVATRVRSAWRGRHHKDDGDGIVHEAAVRAEEDETEVT